MNRRRFMAGVALMPIVAQADCRDHRGMRQPDWDDGSCSDLFVRQGVSGGARVARATFGMGAYEILLEHQKQKQGFRFTFDGETHTIRPTTITIDSNYSTGCIEVIVQGRLT